MKRYKIAHRFVDGLGVDEDPNGEWIKWEDVPIWISVNDRMPDKDALYLVYSPSSDTRKPLIFCAWYSPDVPGWSGMASIWLMAITHWMPLPEPPAPTNFKSLLAKCWLEDEKNI